MPVIGPFNQRVIFEKKSVSQDELGQEIATWTAMKTTWAHRRDMGGDERIRADQPLATRAAIFTVRWFAGLNAGDWRIKNEKTYDRSGNAIDLIWDIEGIAEPRNTRRQYWELTCFAVGV
jgi:SPP1 family predicted phage head-tail adaptor